MRSECSATRDRTILAVRDERHNIIKRANAGKETERWMVENWLREATDARILHEFTADLKKVPTRELVDSVRYLIQVGDLGRIQSVNAVFANRADNRPYKASFHKMLGRLHLFSAHYMSKQSCPPVSQPLLRVEGPSIAAPQNELICRATPWHAV